MADPRYGVEHSGSTRARRPDHPERPAIRLGFNYEQGALRDGIRPTPPSGASGASTCNVAGFLHHRTDKGTFGSLARGAGRNRRAPPHRLDHHRRRPGHRRRWGIAEDQGVPGGNAVTISRYRRGRHRLVFGNTPEDAAVPGRFHRAQGRLGLMFTVGMGVGAKPLLLGPILAERSPRRGSTRPRSTAALQVSHSAWQFSATSVSGPISCPAGPPSSLVKDGLIPTSSRMEDRSASRPSCRAGD
jgi:hypothetical protein